MAGFARAPPFSFGRAAMSYVRRGFAPTLSRRTGVYSCVMKTPDTEIKSPRPDERPIHDPLTGDEREGENEIPLDAPGEDTEAPEEFERIDEVREPAYPDGQPS